MAGPRRASSRTAVAETEASPEASQVCLGAKARPSARALRGEYIFGTPRPGAADLGRGQTNSELRPQSMHGWRGMAWRVFDAATRIHGLRASIHWLLRPWLMLCCADDEKEVHLLDC